jgi:hypothetical protein
MKTLSDCDFAVPEAILAQYYEPDRVYDYYDEGSTEMSGADGWIFLVALIFMTIYTLRNWEKNQNIFMSIFGILFLSGVIFGGVSFLWGILSGIFSLIF